MYFPYLRGKQFELLALRELTGLMAESSPKISPIIEPVKNSSSLRYTIADLEKAGINFNVVLNPTVGEFAKTITSTFQVISDVLSDHTNYQIAIIVDSPSSLHLTSGLWEQLYSSKLRPNGLMFIHNEVTDEIGRIQDIFSKRWPILFNVVNFKRTSRRYYRQFAKSTCVSLDDYFLCLDRNADYLEQDESQFSEEHLFYKEDGFVGFSDFLTIGDDYREGGFLPYAVAIHLSYSDADKRIRVKHFVSESNDDTTDVAGKFAEANQKLVRWCDRNRVNSMAIDKFRMLDETRHFPGLGTIKKLSVMNHIELVLSLI